MKICEEFKSLQGEGKYLGVPSYFIRTTGCNLKCEFLNSDGETTTKCDTPYTSWAPEKGYDLDLPGLLSKLDDTMIQHVVITGGEPLLQRDIAAVANELYRNNYQVTVETNGTIYNDNMRMAFMSISPKLLSATPKDESSKEYLMHLKNNHFMKQVEEWVCSNEFQLKFVYSNKEDMLEINSIVKKLRVHPQRVYLMPQGITKEELAMKQKELFEQCIENGYNYTPRMHIDIWSNIRGV